MMDVGFTGTGRKPLTVEQRTALRAELQKRGPGALHLGDCVHADEECRDIAVDLVVAGHRRIISGYPSAPRLFRLIGHPPTDDRSRAFCRYDEQRTPRPYIQRNHDIVDESDVLLACPGGFKEIRAHSGTWATIRYAVKRYVPVVIIWLDGRTQDGEEFLNGKSIFGA